MTAQRSRGARTYSGRYTVHNKLLRLFLTGVDAVLDRLPFAVPEQIVPINRVLLCTGGHLGDAVVLTAAVRRVRAAFPDAEIGVAAPSWCRVVLADHPDVQVIHEIDHWRFNRASIGTVQKWRRYRATRHAALESIRARGYDVAVDLYAYVPNLAIVLWQSGIPLRAGFESGGFSALYTHRIPWANDDRHIAARHADLLDTVLGPTLHPFDPAYCLAPPDTEAQSRLKDRFAAMGARGRSYILVHMGSGRPEKRWRTSFWRAIIDELHGQADLLVFTGQGAAEKAQIQDVIAGRSDCRDLSNELGWREYVEAIRGARLVVTVDTVATHVAAAVHTSSVVIWLGITAPSVWGPLSTRARVVEFPDDDAEVRTAIRDALAEDRALMADGSGK